MTEDEWFSRGEDLLHEWGQTVIGGLTDEEESAFDYAWELAGREMGIVK